MSDFGYTALHLVASGGRNDAAGLLLSHGETLGGQTGLDLQVRGGPFDCTSRTGPVPYDLSHKSDLTLIIHDDTRSSFNFYGISTDYFITHHTLNGLNDEAQFLSFRLCPVGHHPLYLEK